MAYPKLKIQSTFCLGRLGYTAALVLTEKAEREPKDLVLEERPVWRDGIRVRSNVIRRRGGEKV